jgi:hypothetical protein
MLCSLPVPIVHVAWHLGSAVINDVAVLSDYEIAVIGKDFANIDFALIFLLDILHLYPNTVSPGGGLVHFDPSSLGF